MKSINRLKPLALINPFPRTMKAQGFILPAVIFLASCLSGLSQPVITAQPQNQTNVVGTTARFTVQATGTPPLFYQWRSYTSTVFTNIPGATEASLTVTNVQPSTERFAVVVSNSEGAVTSVLARLVVLLPPIITGQPIHRAVEEDMSATLSVTATGTAPLSYQWRFNGGNLPGQTTPNLVLLNVRLTNTGQYTVVITNLAGAVTSQVARLVFPGPHGFSGITGLEDGRSLLSLTGGVATRFWPYFDLYPVEASTNLMDWTPLVWLLRTNQPPNDLFYVDLEARALNERFYRTFTNHLVTPELPPTG